METKGTYADFVDRMLDEVEFLEAPKATEQLNKLLAACGLNGQPVEEVRKHPLIFGDGQHGMLSHFFYRLTIKPTRGQKFVQLLCGLWGFKK
ncbi:MAG: hypothetical protein ACLP00_00655, partial [Terracidiphilus sp.]